MNRPLHETIFARPNSTKQISKDILNLGVTVRMKPVLDGVATHMKESHPDRTFVSAEAGSVDVERVLRESDSEILHNYIPAGSEGADHFYAEGALSSGISFINCMPVFTVSNPPFAARFAKNGITAVGDNVKAQLGATILHRN